MKIILRNYIGPEDLVLQHEFWVSVTHELPWCWKPTISPLFYSKSNQFDPRSRCFAFNGNHMVGYMSFTGEGEFVSLGYPWVLPGYVEELQEKLYDAVYGFASSPEYGGRVFAQRMRQQWTAQISFFKEHGFSIQRNDDIFALNLSSTGSPSISSSYDIAIGHNFKWEGFCEVATTCMTADKFNSFKIYFSSVNFDFIVKASAQSRLVAYLGFTIRSDTGYSELIAIALQPAEEGVLGSCMAVAINELRSRNVSFLGTNVSHVEGGSQFLSQLGFEKVSEELLLVKKLY
jgi:hypothetical protein